MPLDRLRRSNCVSKAAPTSDAVKAPLQGVRMKATAVAVRGARAAIVTGNRAMALIVAAVGLYGVLAFAVALRRRELGIRSALGARRADLLWLVLREAGTLVGSGLLAGMLLAQAVSRSVESLLFDGQANDPLGVRTRRPRAG